MVITQLPPEAVRLLNALYYGVEDRSAEVVDFRAMMDRCRRRILFQGAYFVDERERDVLANLPYLWDEVESCLSHPDAAQALQRIATPLYEAVRMMEAINHVRERPDYSRQPVVNDFIRAGLACLDGRGEPRALAERLPLLEEACAALEKFYRAAESAMEPEARAGLDKGFGWLAQSVAAIKSAAANPDLDGLRGALADLKKSDLVVQNFLDWNRQREQNLARQYDCFRIPVVGRQAGNMLEAARTVSRRFWKPPIKHVNTFLLPQFRAWWKQARQSALLPAATREASLSAVDRAIAGVEAVVARLLSPEWTEAEAADGLEQALTDLSEALEAVERGALRCDRLQEGRERMYLDVIWGLLRETIADSALQGFVDAFPPSPAWERITDHLNAYMEGGGPEALCGAVEFMLTATAEAPAGDE